MGPRHSGRPASREPRTRCRRYSRRAISSWDSSQSCAHFKARWLQCRQSRPQPQLRSRGDSDRCGGGSGRTGRPHRAHDKYGQRFRPRDGLARRRDHVRHRARRAGVRLGRAVRAARDASNLDHRVGYFIAFLFLLCGAARLARFNVQTNPIPKNPGRPDRKYFIGLPIPAAAAMVAAIVFAQRFDSAAMVGMVGVVAGAAGRSCRF